VDQAKTNTPGADGTREGMDEGKEVCPVRLVGCIVAGYFNDMYICPADVPHDSNTTLTILMSAISRLRQIRGGTLPKYMHFQMDNTNSDNKTHVCLIFGAALVEAGIFEQVTFGFLPVGHTHADIDQCFSRISSYLHRKPAHSLVELQKAVKNTFMQLTYSVILHRADIMDFCRYFSNDTFNKKAFTGSSTVHQFTYKTASRDRNQDLCLLTKEWCRQSDDTKGVDLLQLQFKNEMFGLGEAVMDLTRIHQIIDEMADAKSGGGQDQPVLGQRHRPKKHPTASTYSDRVALLAEQRDIQESACDICITHAQTRSTLGTSAHNTKEDNQAKTVQKRLLDIAQYNHRMYDCSLVGNCIDAL
jgi:hypothetical protein